MMRLLLLLALTAAPAVSAQDAPAAADTPEGAVARLFDGMRARDSSVVASVLHPDLRLMTVMEADGAVRVGESPRAGFLEAIAGAPVVLDERIADLEIRTDGALATAWMTYRFYAGEAFSHCGVNAIQLARLDGRWQMVHVMDTRSRDCGDEPAAD